jgi:hypothetical protein
MQGAARHPGKPSAMLTLAQLSVLELKGTCRRRGRSRSEYAAPAPTPPCVLQTAPKHILGDSSLGLLAQVIPHPCQLPKTYMGPCRHLTASLVGTWGARLGQEAALQRVWPIPGGTPERNAASRAQPLHSAALPVLP